MKKTLGKDIAHTPLRRALLRKKAMVSYEPISWGSQAVLWGALALLVLAINLTHVIDSKSL